MDAGKASIHTAGEAARHSDSTGQVCDLRVHEEAFAWVLERIPSEPIITEPFPHIYVSDIFPRAYYQRLLDRIATVGKFVPALYPGVSVDLNAENFRDYGLACKNFEQDEQLSHLYSFLKSETFARTLLDKFSAPNSWGERGSAIPEEKHVHFKDGRSDFTSVFDLHKDLPGYEITPHPDVPSKIVTILFYLTPNDDIREFGTLLCRPKPEKSAEIASRSIPWHSRLLNRLTVPLVGGYGLKQRDGWFPWEWFDVARVAEARANCFLAFAPNSDSYHAVRMNIPPDHPLQERLTLRGFIRSGANTTNYMSDYSKGIVRKILFRMARFRGILK